MRRKAVSVIMLILFLSFTLSVNVNMRGYLFEEWVPYVPSSAELIYWTSNGISYINVSIMFGDGGFNVSDWGTVDRNGSEIWVDSEIWDWTGYAVAMVITLSHTYDLGLLEGGNYTFTFRAWDVDVKNISFTVPSGPEVCGVDIVHVGIWTQWGTLFPILSLGNEIYFTWLPQVKVTVQNNGIIPINCTVNSYYSDNTTTNLIGTQNVTNLPAGENTTLTFNWDVYDLPQEAVYTVKANVTCHCGASDEFVYGQVKIRLWGDVDGNGVVNILDLKKMKIRIAMVFPEDPWFPFCDLDGNAVVNILDLKKVKLIFSGLL